MKLSELTADEAAGHVRPYEDASCLNIYLDAAKRYVLSHTGLTAEEADGYPDLAVAALILTADLYDNRQSTVDSGNVNRVLESFLDSHRRNLL